jgi:glucose-6-phosphate 1-dehydrogenase
VLLDLSLGHIHAGTATIRRCEASAAYLAIPPALFGKVIDQLKASGCAGNGRAI